MEAVGILGAEVRNGTFKGSSVPGESRGIGHKELLESGHWNGTGGAFPHREAQGEVGYRNWRARSEISSLFPQKKSQWKQQQLPEKAPSHEDTLGSSLDLGASQSHPSLP